MDQGSKARFTFEQSGMRVVRIPAPHGMAPLIVPGSAIVHLAIPRLGNMKQCFPRRWIGETVISLECGLRHPRTLRKAFPILAQGSPSGKEKEAFRGLCCAGQERQFIPEQRAFYQVSAMVRTRACSARSAGLTHSVKINYLIYVTLLQTETRIRKFWKMRLWRRRKIRTSTEIQRQNGSINDRD
jgi:hypothetical protein